MMFGLEGYSHNDLELLALELWKTAAACGSFSQGSHFLMLFCFYGSLGSLKLWESEPTPEAWNAAGHASAWASRLEPLEEGESLIPQWLWPVSGTQDHQELDKPTCHPERRWLARVAVWASGAAVPSLLATGGHAGSWALEIPQMQSLPPVFARRAKGLHNLPSSLDFGISQHVSDLPIGRDNPKIVQLSYS